MRAHRTIGSAASTGTTFAGLAVPAGDRPNLSFALSFNLAAWTPVNLQRPRLVVTHA